MASTHYHYHVYRIESTDQQQHRPLQNVKPTDSLRFKVIALLRFRSSDSNSHACFIRLPPLLQTSISITCERFFGDNKDFLRRHITNQPYFPPECLDQITEKIIPQVQQLFKQSLAFDTGFARPSYSESQEFHLALDIVVDEVNDDVVERAVMEESMQHVRMIPASNEAIKSLKTYKLPDQCHICKEKFHGEGDDDDDDDDDDDVEFTPLPCGHGFHHQYIVQRLQTSHMCPMCRYSLATTNN